MAELSGSRGEAVRQLLGLMARRRELWEAKRTVMDVQHPDAGALDHELQQIEASINDAADAVVATKPSGDAGALPPGPPDVGGFLQAIFAPVADGGLGKERARELARAYPEFAIAMDRGDYATARAAVDEALADAVVTQGEFDTIQALFTAFNIPDPAP